MSSFARLASVGAVVKAVRLALRPGGPSLGERAGAVPRLVRATASRDYRGTSASRLLLMLAAAGYIVSPVDLVPEGLLGIFGLADDAMVLSWLATRLVEETERFLEWERTQGGMPNADGSSGRGWPPPTASAYGAPGSPYPAPGSPYPSPGSPYPAPGSPYGDPGSPYPTAGPPRSAAGSQTVRGDVVP
jgi:uncharacterized membrane protein YkvA (DUF1232 family)